MLQFSCRFAFLPTFRLSNRTLKITRKILKISNYVSHCLSTWRHSVMKAKFWSKVCMNVKVIVLGSL